MKNTNMTPDQMTATEVTEKIIELAQKGSKEKANQLMSFFNEKISNTGRAVLRELKKIIEINKKELGKDLYDEMSEKIQTCM